MAATAAVAPCGLRRAPLLARCHSQQPTLHSCLGLQRLPQRVHRRRAQVNAQLQDGIQRHEDAQRQGLLRSDISLGVDSVAPMLAGQGRPMLSLAGWLTLLAAGGVADRADASEVAVEEWQGLKDSLVQELGVGSDVATGVESTTGSATLSEGVPSTDAAAEAVRSAESTIADSVQHGASADVDAVSAGSMFSEQASKLQDSAASALQSATDGITSAGSTADAAPNSAESASQLSRWMSDMVQSTKDSALDGSSVDAASSGGPSISERASQFMNSATDALQSARDSISEQFSNAPKESGAVEGSKNIDAASSAAPSLSERASQLVEQFSDAPKDLAAVQGSDNIDAAASSAPTLSERASQLFEQFSSAPSKSAAIEGSDIMDDPASSAAPSLSERASQLLDSASDALQSAKDSASEKVSNAVQSASDSASSLTSAPVEEPSVSSTLSNALENAASSAADSASPIAESARTAVESVIPSSTPNVSSAIEQYRSLTKSVPVAPPQQSQTPSFEAPKFNFSNPLEAAQEAGKSISETLSNLPGSLKSGLEGVRDGIKGTLSGVKPPSVNVPGINNLVPSTDGLTQGLKSLSPTAANEALVQLKGSVRSVAGEATSTVGKGVGAAASTVGKGVGAAASTVGKGVGAAASTAASAAGQVLTTAGGVITEKAGQLSVELHKLPAEYQPAVQVLETGASYVAFGVTVASSKVSEVVAALAANPQSQMVVTIVGLGAVTAVIVSAAKGALGNYAGEMIAARKAYELVKDQGAVLIDFRSEQERSSKGVPDFKRGARSRLRFVQEEPLERSQRKQFTDPDDVELQILAAKILGQTGVAAYTPLVLMDSDGRVPMQVAKTLLDAGAQRVYRISGGFESGWVPSGLPIRPDEDLPALKVLTEDAQEIVQETVQAVKESPEKVFLPLLGVTGSVYTVFNYEYVLEMIGVLAILQLVYKKVSSYDSLDDFYRDIVRLILSVQSFPSRVTKSTSKAAKALQEYQKLPEQLPAGAPTPQKTEFEVASEAPAAPKAESNAS
eukprot:jgi/Chlat1/7441/Chrsp6S07493